MNKITDKDFNEVIKEGVILVDFWAEWCGPCVSLKPTLLQAQEETQAKILFLNVDENRTITANNHIRALPTMIIFKDGVEVDRLSGTKSKKEILEAIQVHL